MTCRWPTSGTCIAQKQCDATGTVQRFPQLGRSLWRAPTTEPQTNKDSCPRQQGPKWKNKPFTPGGITGSKNFHALLVNHGELFMRPNHLELLKTWHSVLKRNGHGLWLWLLSARGRFMKFLQQQGYGPCRSQHQERLCANH